MCKLKLLRNSQTDKLHILAKLDDELIELVSEEQLEAEGEESDLYREWVGLAIISLDDTLKGELMVRPLSQLFQFGHPAHTLAQTLIFS